MQLDAADVIFSKYIRLRDGRCKRCKSPVVINMNGDPVSHQNSHFQVRRKEATRFDEDNADCLCDECHRYFTVNPREHYLWQVSIKGQELVDAIILKSNGYMKKDRKAVKAYWTQRYKELKERLYAR